MRQLRCALTKRPRSSPPSLLMMMALRTAIASSSTPDGASATATVTAPIAFEAQPPPSVHPGAVTDGYSSDEEPRVFMADEIQSDDEELAVILTRRRRACLAGCVCEKERGRKCTCEKIGEGQCDDQCGCDKTKCRAFIAEEPVGEAGPGQR